MTNGDRIRLMSNKELFNRYFRYMLCFECDFRGECRAHRNSTSTDDEENYRECSDR